MTLNASVRRMNEEQRTTILALEAENAKLREACQAVKGSACPTRGAPPRIVISAAAFQCIRAALAETERKATEAAGG